MFIKIIFVLSVFLTAHSLTMMHVCYVSMIEFQSNKVPIECVQTLSANYSAWCVSATFAFSMLLISNILHIVWVKNRPIKSVRTCKIKNYLHARKEARDLICSNRTGR